MSLDSSSIRPFCAMIIPMQIAVTNIETIEITAEADAIITASHSVAVAFQRCHERECSELISANDLVQLLIKIANSAFNLSALLVAVLDMNLKGR